MSAGRTFLFALVASVLLVTINSLVPCKSRPTALLVAATANVHDHVIGNDMLETDQQRLLVGTHFALSAISLTHVFAAHDVDIVRGSCIFLASFALGDFSTGVFHWAVDNYGSISTPIFGSVCHAFQGHHEAPWTITKRTFANNVHKITYGTIPAQLLTFSVHDNTVQLFLVLCVNWWLLSQEYHKWAHLRSVPKPIAWLHNTGLIISKKEHGLHHSSPFDSNYCILNGMCNPFLDKTRFFPVLEKVVHSLTGNKPRNWLERQASAQTGNE